MRRISSSTCKASKHSGGSSSTTRNACTSCATVPKRSLHYGRRSETDERCGVGQPRRRKTVQSRRLESHASLHAWRRHPFSTQNPNSDRHGPLRVFLIAVRVLDVGTFACTGTY